MIGKIIEIFKDLKNRNTENLEIEIALKELQKLGKKYMSGLSEDADIQKWDFYLSIIKFELLKNPNDEHLSFFSDGIDEVFSEYLLLHHPNNARLNLRYQDDEEKEDKRRFIYRKMLLIALGETIFLVHKWEFKNKEEYMKFILSIKEYVDYRNDYTREHIIETSKCNELSNDELNELVFKISKEIPQNTNEQKEWHEKIERLSVFKI